MSGGLDQRVGLVSGIEPSASGEFVVALDPQAHLAVDDLVCVQSAVPGIPDPVLTFGIVTENHATLEGAQYQSDTHRISDEGLRPAQLVRSAQIAVTRILPEVWVAPSPGAPVFRVAGERRRQAIYHDTMSRPLAVGVDTRGEPVFIDVRYFDGDSGGHMSISGISGVATKTTYALFFLRLLVSGGLGPEAANTRVLVFNVKGEDLLWLDKRSNQFSAEDERAWRRLGTEAGPFALAGGAGSGPSVSFWAPAAPAAPDTVVPDVAGRQDGVGAFYWTPREFVEQGLLRFVFADPADERSQLGFVEERVRTRLQRECRAAGRNGALVLDGNRIEDLGSLARAIGQKLEPEDDQEADYAWTGRVAAGTISAFMRRLLAAASPMRLGRLVRCGPPRGIDRGLANLTVVSIANLHEHAQRFVVGALLKETFEEKERTGTRLPLSVVMLDELNKYAPRSGDSPIKEMLVDIAQRGRSLGVLLVGAQQSASRVDASVLDNAAIKVVGRMDAAEVMHDQYGWMLPSMRQRARLLRPGQMVLQQPTVPVPLTLRFPRVPWATRADEVADDPAADPFAGLA
ncbi:MAG: ATP-binding protein [Chloroflexota bacterium]|nr:ATP-binding protein [Chloroflexota bacterium]